MMGFDDYTVIFFRHAPKAYDPEEVNPHITFLPLFRVFSMDPDITAELLLQTIKNIAQRTMSFAMTATSHAWFGPNQDIEVLLLSSLNQEDLTLHQKLLEVINPFTIQHHFPNYISANFHPHMTAAEMTEEEITVDRITLVRNVNGFGSGDDVQFYTIPFDYAKS